MTIGAIVAVVVWSAFCAIVGYAYGREDGKRADRKN